MNGHSFVDFDGTIFNTELFKVALFEMLHQLNETFDLLTVEKTYLHVRSINPTGYSPKFHFERLLSDTNIPQEEHAALLAKFMKSSDDLFSTLSDYVFPDAIDFLRKHPDAIILTAGETRYQIAKVVAALDLDDSRIIVCNDGGKAEELWNFFLRNAMDHPEHAKFSFYDNNSDNLMQVAGRFPNADLFHMVRDEINEHQHVDGNLNKLPDNTEQILMTSTFR